MVKLHTSKMIVPLIVYNGVNYDVERPTFGSPKDETFWFSVSISDLLDSGDAKKHYLLINTGHLSCYIDVLLK